MRAFLVGFVYAVAPTLLPFKLFDNFRCAFLSVFI